MDTKSGYHSHNNWLVRNYFPGNALTAAFKLAEFFVCPLRLNAQVSKGWNKQPSSEPEEMLGRMRFEITPISTPQTKHILDWNWYAAQ
jgi:hypothetical protein